MTRFDVAVVGLGTAGAATAAFCARAGLRVVGLDARPLGDAGAHWINGVPAWTFPEVGLSPPEPPERVGAHVPFHLVAGWGPTKVLMREVENLEVDMRHLVARLQREAQAAGADLRGEVRVQGREGRRLRTGGEPIEAEVFVDAAGLAGPRLLRQSPCRPEDLCAAAQYVHELRDEGAARAWLADNGVGWGETLCFAGVAGGYSILNVRIHEGTVSILTGSLPALGHRSGVRLVDDFLSAHAFVGPRIFGGQRAIPLRPPPLRVTEGRVAGVGDAVDQVHPAHGSGITPQLLAAKLLADALAHGEGLPEYDARYRRERAGRLAAADIFRRYSQTMPLRDFEAMVRRGVMSPGVMADALAQRAPRPPLRDVARAARGALGLPHVAVSLGPVVARMEALEQLYARAPRKPRRLPGFRRVAERVSGRPLRLRPSDP